MLLVHSLFCDADQTVERLRAGGLDTDVIARQRGPLGPLLTAGVSALEARGLLAKGRREEEVLVIRGRRPLGRAECGDPARRRRHHRLKFGAARRVISAGACAARRRRLRRGRGLGRVVLDDLRLGLRLGLGARRGSIPFARMRASRLSSASATAAPRPPPTPAGLVRPFAQDGAESSQKH